MPTVCADELSEVTKMPVGNITVPGCGVAVTILIVGPAFGSVVAVTKIGTVITNWLVVGGGVLELSNLVTAKMTAAVISTLRMINVKSERRRMVSLVFEPSPPFSRLMKYKERNISKVNVFLAVSPLQDINTVG